MVSKVSFTTNACITDIPYIDKTLRHMIRSLHYEFFEKIVALDPGMSIGKYESRHKGNLEDLRKILLNLVNDGIIDRVVEIPPDPLIKNELLNKYFAKTDIQLKDLAGAPIYQYLYAMDICQGDYILHVDSDMLFYPGTGTTSWIEDGIQIINDNPQVLFATPNGGPPQAKTWMEKFLGKPNKNYDALEKWSKSTSVSTRYFLLDKNRFLTKLLPLKQEKPAEPLEKSLTFTAQQRGFERWSMNTYDGWAIHPVTHDNNFIEHLDDLIEVIEKGLYPFNRVGFQWNMYTEGKQIKPWLRVIENMRR